MWVYDDDGTILYDLYQTLTEYDRFILLERTGVACLFLNRPQICMSLDSSYRHQ